MKKVVICLFMFVFVGVAYGSTRDVTVSFTNVGTVPGLNAIEYDSNLIETHIDGGSWVSHHRDKNVTVNLPVGVNKEQCSIKGLDDTTNIDFYNISSVTAVSANHTIALEDLHFIARSAGAHKTAVQIVCFVMSS